MNDRHRVSTASWVPAIWILCGVEVLVALYLRSLLGFAMDRPDPSWGELAWEMAALIAKVNSLAAVALWVRFRDPGRRPSLGRLARCGGMILVLALLSLVFVTFAQHPSLQLPEAVLVWELGSNGEYTIRP